MISLRVHCIFLSILTWFAACFCHGAPVFEKRSGYQEVNLALQVEALGQSLHGAYLSSVQIRTINKANISDFNISGVDFAPAPYAARFAAIDLGNPINNISSAKVFSWQVSPNLGLKYTFYSVTGAVFDFIERATLYFLPSLDGNYLAPLILYQPPSPALLPRIRNATILNTDYHGGNMDIAVESAKGGSTWVVCGQDGDYISSGYDEAVRPVNYRSIYWGPPGIWNSVHGKLTCSAVTLQMVPCLAPNGSYVSGFGDCT